MEGIGAAAIIIAVVGLAAKACGVVYKYVDSARGCIETTSQLYKELEVLHKLLERLANVAKQLDAAAQDAAPGKFRDTIKWGSHFQGLRDVIKDALILGSSQKKKCKFTHVYFTTLL